MPAPLLQQTPQQSQQPQQQRSRFEHPQQPQALLGRGGSAPGSDNQRMPGMANNRDEYFDPKRMRRF